MNTRQVLDHGAITVTHRMFDSFSQAVDASALDGINALVPSPMRPVGYGEKTLATSFHVTTYLRSRAHVTLRAHFQFSVVSNAKIHTMHKTAIATAQSIIRLDDCAPFAAVPLRVSRHLSFDSRLCDATLQRNFSRMRAELYRLF